MNTGRNVQVLSEAFWVSKRCLGKYSVSTGEGPPSCGRVMVLCACPDSVMRGCTERVRCKQVFMGPGEHLLSTLEEMVGCWTGQSFIFGFQRGTWEKVQGPLCGGPTKLSQLLCHQAPCAWPINGLKWGRGGG